MRSAPFDNSGDTGGDILEELLRLEDGKFVRAAYERLLGRSPAEEELDLWLAPLRGGSRSKLDVLAAIRYSPEGRARGVSLPGLVAPRETGWIQRLPIVGYAIRWIQQLATLPRLARRLESMEATLTANARIDARRARSIDRIDDVLRVEGQRITGLETGVKVVSDTAFSRHVTLTQDLRQIEETAFSRHETLTQDLRQIEDVKADLSLVQDVDARIRALWDWVTPAGSLGAGVGARSPSDADEATRSGAFDDYYRRFEDHFRGSPEQIRERLSFYLPIFEGVAQQLSVDPPARFVDLGCGRGELIQLLCAQGLQAYGVENSEAMVTRCRDNGLAVVCADALEHLESLAADSLAGVASIHVIEHLPFLALKALFAEAFRVLRPGGVAIFETPNPENLIVGACNFYYDPTHIRPLPPEPMRFLLEASGFARVAIERLHSGATLAQVDSASDPVAKMYSTIMLVPQDYALIAYKPSLPEAHTG